LNDNCPDIDLSQSESFSRCFGQKKQMPPKRKRAAPATKAPVADDDSDFGFLPGEVSCKHPATLVVSGVRGEPDWREKKKKKKNNRSKKKKKKKTAFSGFMR
jgi:hypothetical protein